jgi:hypothetical protein
VPGPRARHGNQCSRANPRQRSRFSLGAHRRHRSLGSNDEDGVQGPVVLDVESKHQPGLIARPGDMPPKANVTRPVGKWHELSCQFLFFLLRILDSCRSELQRPRIRKSESLKT